MVLLPFIFIVSTVLASHLPFPALDLRSASLNINTPLGRAIGTPDPSGAVRYVVKYANANRWAPSTLLSTWDLPSGAPNATGLPLPCPQPPFDPSTSTEDCLSMILYVPPGIAKDSAVPTFMWLHGGSFVIGSATDPGLDGSKLAIATQSIVAVVQYRLGGLGLLAPDGKTNLAVVDVINAMEFLNKIIPAFGGSASKITIAGQSSGGTLIRALLAAPSASSLFRSAIIQSDPMNYGFLAPTTQTKLQSSYNRLINCTSYDKACWNSLSLDTILNAETTLLNQSMEIDPSTGLGEPLRPVRDGSLITSPLDSTAPFPPVKKPVLISTVLNEAGYTVYSQFPQPLPTSMLSPVLSATLGPNRTDIILASDFYPPVPSGPNGTVDARDQLESIGTDYMWRCPSWTFARAWRENGGTPYVALYHVGASYPGNSVVSYCKQAGNICHQDEIELVFGTVPNPSPSQAAVVNEIQKRYRAFLHNGDPNVDGLATWSPATTSDVHPLRLGGSGEIPVGACEPTFWGGKVPYDYQIFGI